MPLSVTVPTGAFINTAVSGDRTTASGLRRVFAALLAQSAAGVPTPGILALAGLTPLDIVTSASVMTYNVLAGFAVTSRTNQGAYIVGSLSESLVDVAVGDASNPRIDRIYIVQPDPELAEAGVARIEVVQGTPGANPSLPAIPAGALELGRKLVPAGASNTNAGTPISNKAALTGLNVLASQVGGLTVLLDAKAALSHTHTASQVTDLSTNGNAARVGGVKITVQTTATADPSSGNTLNDLLFEF